MNATNSFASLYTGGGGVDLGAIMAGMTPIWGIENDSHTCEVFRANFDSPILCEAVEDVNLMELDRPDVLWASPPCQEHSKALGKKYRGRRDKDASRAIIPFLRALRPRAFILENVWGYHRSESYHKIIGVLYRLGYFVNVNLLDAADFGVPQNRKRLILVAIQEGLVPALPTPTAHRGWYGAIADLLPGLKEGVFPVWQREVVERALTMGRGEFMVDGKALRDKYHPTCYRLPTVRFQYQPSFCILASAYAAIRATCQGTVRTLDKWCLARLQGFPDTYQLPKQNAFAKHIIGNAVPPPFAAGILSSL